MHIICKVVFRFLTIRSRSITTLIALSLLLGFAPWSMVWSVKIEAAPTPQPAPSGFIYVLNDCSDCANRIFGFAVNETTGALTPLTNGFPVSTGGNGKTGFSSDLLTIDRNNLRLFALNVGSKTFSAFTIDPATGALTAMFNPIALKDTVGFTTIAAHPKCQDTLLAIGGLEPDNPGGFLASFRITATAAMPFSSQTTGEARPLYTVFRQDGSFLYTGGGGPGSKFAAFSINASGALNPLNDVGFDSLSSDPRGYAMDAGGRLFMANRFFQQQQLRVFTTTNGTPVLIPGPTVLTTLREVGRGVVHPNGQFYLVSDLSSNVDLVVVAKFNGSSATPLTLVPGSPFHSGGTAVKLLAFNESGKFLFAGNQDTHNITTFEVDPGTGVLTRLVTQTPGALGGTGSLNGVAYLPPSTGPSKTITTTAIDAPAITFGENGKVIVTVNSVIGTPSGRVSLSVDGDTPTLQPLLPDGTATFTINSPTAGNHSLVVDFLPEQEDCFSSRSATGTLVVNEAETITNIVALPIRFGLNGRVTVNVSSQFVTPSGNVTLRVDGGAAMTQALSGGSATFTILMPSRGTHSLRAVFPAQGGFKASSDVEKLVVRQPLNTVTRINAPTVILHSSPIVQTAPVTVRVTSSSFPFVNASGNVTLSVDNHAEVTQPLSGGSVTFHIVVSKIGFHLCAPSFPRKPASAQAGQRVFS